MTQYFPIVVEQESNGTFSAWVAGLPGVYAAADTATAAKRGIRDALAAHLDALRRLGREPAAEGRRDRAAPRRVRHAPRLVAVRGRRGATRPRHQPREGRGVA
jgi:predicted RNase H-like HicB family nuclease